LASRLYYTLVASLPALPPHFDVDRAPITRPRLLERLKMLEPEDAALVDLWMNFVLWDQQVLDRKDEEFAAKYESIQNQISNATLRKMFEVRMDTRTIIAAVRRRRAGLSPPTIIGQWVEQIRRNYDHPEFRMQTRFDWIAKFSACLESGDALQAQWVLFDNNYRLWTSMAERYTFSFESVLLYLARWEIIDRWTSRDPQAGQERFETMITETLGEYAHLFQ
jgi:hypothetical protein